MNTTIKSILITVALSFGAIWPAHAQVKTVTGKVTDESGEALQDVFVSVEGAHNSGYTDAEGKYTLEAKEGQKLLFESLGFEKQTVSIGEKSVYNISLRPQAQKELKEVVVVGALGVKRKKDALGYSVQEVKGEDLTNTQPLNALNALSGKAAGVFISTPTGNLGGSTRILIRGANSILGENRPLIVVVGIPLDNTNYNTLNTQRGSGGIDYGDMGADVNPDDIENVSVLKGGPASALYGSRALNGAIVITTKKAKKDKTSIQLNSGVSFDQVYNLPRLQRMYGGGRPQDDKSIGIFSPYKDKEGNKYETPYFMRDESWGPKFDPNKKVLHWDAFDPEFKEDYLKPRPWVAPKNDVESFFRIATTYHNGVSFSKSFQKSGVRASLNNVRQESVLPNGYLSKTNLSLNAFTDITEKLKFEGNLNYAYTKGFNRPVAGYDGIVSKFFQWGQRQVDFQRLKEYRLPPNTEQRQRTPQRTWNRKLATDPTPEYTDNPYWDRYENYSDDYRNRFFGFVGLTYEIIKGLSVSGKIKGDYYSFAVRERQAIGSQAQPYYREYKREVKDFNYELMLNYAPRLSQDFSLNSFIGLNKWDRKFDELRVMSNGGLRYPNIWNIQNSQQSPTAEDENSAKRVNSVYGMASIGYKNMLFLEVTGRNDWSSTLPPGKNSYFYPSATLSWIFSKILNVNWLNYGKLRLGWAKTGNDTDPYRLVETYKIIETKKRPNIEGPFGNAGLSAIPRERSNPNLRPEMQATREIGAELGLFKNRLSLDFTYYNNMTTDQIIALETTAGSGYPSQVFNVGKISNKGVEFAIGVAPIKTENFRWDLSVNFAKNVNRVEQLMDGKTTNLQIFRAPFRVTVNAIEGKTMGEIMGKDFTYDDKGNKIVDSDGLYVPSGIKSLGSIFPDYNMGIRNGFVYKNFDFGFLIDIQKGGKYFSTTHMHGMASGVLEKTAANGIRENGIILPGVVKNSDGSYSKNEKVILAHAWAQGFANSVDAQNVFDADYIKLRELSVGYTFRPTGENVLFKSIRFSIYGRNLFTWGLAFKGVDPEAVGNGSGNIQGIEGGSLPSTRTYGFNIQAHF